MHQVTMDLYPITPGYKTAGPSKEAAEAVGVSEKRRAVFRQILSNLRREGPATADEMSERLGLERLYVRPRMSELRKLGFIEDSGERRRNHGGRPASVWRLCDATVEV